MILVILDLLENTVGFFCRELLSGISCYSNKKKSGNRLLWKRVIENSL